MAWKTLLVMAAVLAHLGASGASVALNPQPLPPGHSIVIGSKGKRLALNPQPLPPRHGGGGQTKA